MTGRDTLPESVSASGSSILTPREEHGPPCKRCGGRVWDVQTRPKGRARWLLEMVFAAPDVWIFQSESAGWPRQQYERWTCKGCGRRARVAL